MHVKYLATLIQLFSPPPLLCLVFNLLVIVLGAFTSFRLDGLMI
nr:MAG TPA: hypothetical protein [Caudoviricetes sp.]